MTRARASLVAVLLATLGLAPGAAGAATIPVVYDSEFQGYVPIVDGIERPDLVALNRQGRVPEEARDAEREARRTLRRALRRGTTLPPELTIIPGEVEPGRRFMRRVAVITDLEILDDDGHAIEGARVYRYYDPSFYAINEDAGGARLAGFLRYMPRSNPAMDHLASIARHERFWLDTGHAAVSASLPDIDHRRNPFARAGARGLGPAIEYLGRTDSAGTLRSVSGIFNLRDRERFPHAIVPSTIRIGFVVVAPGFAPAFSEARFREGGVREARRIALLRGPGHEVLGSQDLRVAERIVDVADLAGDDAETRVLATIDEALRRIDGYAARVPQEMRARATLIARLSIIERLYRRAPPALRETLARRALDEAPTDPTALVRVAMLLAAAPDATADALAEAERLVEIARREDTLFLPAYALHDALLARRQAPANERLRLHRRLLAVTPFSPWCRSQLATLLLDAGNAAEAFDHLRYTPAALVGLGGERDLARALADHYWRQGLVEKAGLWPFLLTGRPPEDPALRPRGRTR